MPVYCKDLKSEKGMTLVELIIVVVILTMLIAALGIGLTGKFGQAKEKIAQIEISKIEGQLNIYMLELGNYPDGSVGLEALVVNVNGSANGDGPYLKKIELDPWNNPYVYQFPSAHGMEYDLCSNGPDGAEGTEDDICNWK